MRLLIWSPVVATRELNVSAGPLDMDEPAELSFSEKKGKIVLGLMDMIRFEHLSAALIFAVNTMHDSHRPNCMITTQSGSIYRWSDIPALYETAKLVR